MRNILILNGKAVAPLFTSAQASGKEIVHGEDEQGEFVACRLDNRSDATLFGWYILVSPDDLELVTRYPWHGNICGDTDHVMVRRRQNLEGKIYDLYLNREIWTRLTGQRPSYVYKLGHPLDYRRHNLSTNSSRALKHGFRGVVFHGGKWQVQIAVGPHGKNVYVGRAAHLDEGYRLYNRYLQELKENQPDNAVLQAMPFNEIIPMF